VPIRRAPKIPEVILHSQQELDQWRGAQKRLVKCRNGGWELVTPASDCRNPNPTQGYPAPIETARRFAGLGTVSLRDVYSLDRPRSTAFTASGSNVLKLKAFCKDIEMQKQSVAGIASI
jgi:hypothetical protein